MTGLIWLTMDTNTHYRLCLINALVVIIFPIVTLVEQYQVTTDNAKLRTKLTVFSIGGM